jgi:hypothetical protein
MIVTQGADIAKLQIGNYGSAPIEFFTDNTFRAIITSDGNVGIGTNSPAAKLDIDGNITNSAGDLQIGLTTGGSLNFLSGTSTTLDGGLYPLYLSSDDGVSVGTPGGVSVVGDTNLYLASLGTVTIDPDIGHVIICPIGTGVSIGSATAPTAKLDVDGDVRVRGALRSAGEMLYLWSNFR